MLLEVDDIRMAVGFSPLVFCQGVPERLKRSPRGDVVGFCRIPGSMACIKQLPNEGFVRRQGDCEVIELEHGISESPTILVERPVILSGPARFLKRNVLILFYPMNSARKFGSFKLKFNLFSKIIATLTNSVKKNRLKINALESFLPIKLIVSTSGRLYNRPAGVF